MSTPDTARTPDWLLERIALGELPAAELAHARARLLAEPDGAARLAALEAANATDARTLHTRAPPAAFAERVRRAAGVRPAAPTWRTPLLALVPALGLAALAMVLVRGPALPTVAGPDEGPEVTRVKGLDARLQLHRQGAGGAEALADGARVAAGDVVQVAYVVPTRGHGVVLSLDGRGAVTLHLPQDGAGRAVELQPGGARALPQAYALDDAPGFERFVLVTGAQPFDVEPVLAAARALAASPDAQHAPLLLPRELAQTSQLLRK